MADKFYAGQTDYILELNLLDSGVTGSASAAADSAAEAAASAAVAGAFENYEGVWLSSTTYLIGDSVNHSDSFWISNINTNLNSEPTEFNSDWSDIGANATLEAIAAAEAAEISETNSEDSNLESGDWANRAEDSLTRTFADGVGTNRPAGNYSALHHAEKASASATTSTNAANAASGDADDAHTDATLALGYKNNAFASEGNAATSEGNAATSESNASTSASTATTQAGLSTGSAVNSEDSNLESEDWANRVEDSLTRTFLDGVGSDRTSGNYSALHHASKASASASSASSSASAASTSADEAAVYSDYTGPWSSGTTYVIGESVSHSDKLWLATTGSLNSEPTDVNSDWFYLATELEGDSVNYVSGWNALINIPAIPVASIDNKGNYYVVSVEGSTLIDGISTWKIDDWIVSNGSVWQRVNNSGSVISVAGKDGVVLLDTDDITEATNLFYTEARVDGNSNVSANTSARHTHSNTIVLDNTTASYIVAEQAKLGGIEENATSDQTSGEIEAIVSHNNLQGVSVEEHIDWTVSQGATDIHPDNYDSAGSGVWSSDTPPTDKATYPVWFNTDTGKTWTWYTDADGSQWVQDVATTEALVIDEAQIAHKADKVVVPTADNLLSMDATGNLEDSGIASTDVVLNDGVQALHSTDALSISGSTISLNKGDGSTETVVAPNDIYTHPTHPGDDIAVDTGALTGATVVSDIDINVTTDVEGHVTDANGVVSTRTLTPANIGALSTTGTAADSSKLGGLSLSSNGNNWGVIPHISSGGVIEIGAYIDFNNTDTTTTDFNWRLNGLSTDFVLYDSTSSYRFIVRTDGTMYCGAAPVINTDITNKSYVDGTLSANSNGYMEFPGGLIIQWGNGLYSNGETVTFPRTFPNACRSVTATMFQDYADSSILTAHARSKSTSSFSIIGRYKSNNGNTVSWSGDVTAAWIAVGN